MPVSLLSRYMFLQTLLGLAVALLVVGAVIILVDFVELSRSIGTRVDIGAIDLLGLTLLKAPSLIETTLPFVFLFGVLSALFQLSRRSELIVMRGSGMSAWRILNAPMFLAIVVGIFSTTALNPLGAAGNAAFERQRDALMDVRRDPNAEEPVWLREVNQAGFTVIAARALVEDTQTLQNPAFLFYTNSENGGPRFDHRIDAETAQLHDGYWEIRNGIDRAADSSSVSLGEQSQINTSINRQALFERSRSPEGLSLWDLPELIESAEEAGLATETYELRLHSLLAFPLTLLAATLIAAGATLRLHRLGGAAAFAISGGIAGFVMFFFQELLSSLGATGALPPSTAAWAAPALTALLALIYIASTEDG
jgi:lipopolysaccharide export system permease protein